MASGPLFAATSQALLRNAISTLQEWLPGGKVRGNEFVCGNLQGDPGESLSINHTTGAWGEFATGQKGGDLVSLYAGIHSLSQSEALKRLSAGGHTTFHVERPKPEEGFLIPAEGDLPEDPTTYFKHPSHGFPESVHVYREYEGRVAFYVARYQPSGATKQFSPWTWTGERWRMKAPPKPRLLYGLEKLKALNGSGPRRVLLLEGEKSADAAQKLFPSMACLSWYGGVGGLTHAEWLALKGRDVLMWPDNDEAGKTAMASIAGMLGRIGNIKLRVIDIPADMPKKWDAADALEDGWTTQAAVDWSKPKIRDWNGALKAPAETFAGHVVVNDAPARVLPLQPRPKAPAPAPPKKSVPARATSWGGLATTAGGMPHFNMDNAVRVMEREVEGAIWLDTFLQRIMTAWNGPKREWTDADDLEVLMWLQREKGLFKFSKGTVRDAIENYARQHPRNECREWIEAQAWDGVDRLAQLFPDAFGSKDDEFTQAVGGNWFIGMVARVLEPGCQMDNVVVLEGEEAMRKSTALRVIGGDWFSEVHDALSQKDFQQSIQGLMLAEIPEMYQFTSSEIDKVKGVITNRDDRYRSSYGHRVEKHPRQCTFTGTTNRDDWNKSVTGARRFWPIRCGPINLEYLRDLRGQLFGEALARYRRGESWWEVPEALAKAEVEARRDRDIWESRVDEILEEKNAASIEYILDKLEVKPNDQTNQMRARIVTILKSLGWRKSGTPVKGQVAWERAQK